MITGMDRLAAASRGERLDRIPVFCNLFDQGARELGIVSLKDYYAHGEYVAEAQLRMREKYGYDNLWTLFYVGKEAELFGCRNIIWSDSGSPNVGEFIIKSPEDIAHLAAPEDIGTHPAYRECSACAGILFRESAGKYPIVSYLTSSFTLPTLLMGMEAWLDLLFRGPADVRDTLLTICSQFFKKHAQYHLTNGTTSLVYSIPFASTHILPMRMIDELVFPWMERDLEGLDRAGIIFYCGGAPFNNVIEKAIERLGIQNFYLSPMADISEGRRIAAGRGVICGVIDDVRLIHCSHTEIRSEVRRILDAGMPGNRFAFGVQGMPLGIPEDNIRCMIDAACEFGSFRDTES